MDNQPIFKNGMTLSELYLSWVNDFISSRMFAEHYGLSMDEVVIIQEFGERAQNWQDGQPDQLVGLYLTRGNTLAARVYMTEREGQPPMIKWSGKWGAGCGNINHIKSEILEKFKRSRGSVCLVDLSKVEAA